MNRELWEFLSLAFGCLGIVILQALIFAGMIWLVVVLVRWVLP